MASLERRSVRDWLARTGWYCFRFTPFTTPCIHSTLRRVFSSVPLHASDATPSQPVPCRYSMQARMFSAMTPPPTKTSELR